MFMSHLRQTVATLRFFGNDLDPEEITRLLGAVPTVGVRKGGVWRNSGGALKTVTRGSWWLEVQRRSPGDLDGQITELLQPLSGNLAVWKELTSRFKTDVFCGLFLDESNEGISIAPDTLLALGSRGLTFDMDIYAQQTSN